MRLGEELLVDPVGRPAIFDGGRVIGFRQITGHGGVLFLQNWGARRSGRQGGALGWQKRGYPAASKSPDAMLLKRIELVEPLLFLVFAGRLVARIILRRGVFFLDLALVAPASVPVCTWAAFPLCTSLVCAGASAGFSIAGKGCIIGRPDRRQSARVLRAGNSGCPCRDGCAGVSGAAFTGAATAGAAPSGAVLELRLGGRRQRFRCRARTDNACSDGRSAAGRLATFG